uniref:ubiquitinyl hydrolase 1 n=1 Tax=Panagrolaimus davidi TaxID=227884 RepID=A0A914QH00_9BILA
MERLQAVFFALELSPFEASDAVRLADALMLQDSQQDVSEFHTLFFNFLEKHLEGHPSLPLFKKVHEKVNFHTKQVLECTCGRKTQKHEVNAGLHLNPDGCTNVTEMIHKAFGSIILSDYRCPECNEIGNTEMKNVPVSLPPILIFQISRVALDHRKDRTAIHYPRRLNESTLLKEVKGNHKYLLHAVCVHDGTAASSGHYHDYILDSRRKQQWFHFNDANVKAIKPPGVENENDTVLKPTADMRGCYLLLYRKDSDVAEDREEIPLPRRANIIEKRLRIESERLRHSNERSERYWYKRAQEALNRVEKTVSDLKITSLDIVKKKPQDVVFIPTSLLLDFIEKEYKAVETMVNLNKLEDNAAEERKQKRKEKRAKEQDALEAAESNNLHQKYLKVDKLTPEMIAAIENANEPKNVNGRPKRTPKKETVATQNNLYIADSSDESDVEEPEPDEDTYKHLYVPDELGSYDMSICMHGKVPLSNILQGELKAVKKQAAEKFVKAYGIQMKKKSINHLEGSNSGYSTCQCIIFTIFG